MASQISTLDLIAKARRFITSDEHDAVLEELIKEAIIMADREIRRIDMVPLAWDVQPYDGLRTRMPAQISAVTQADPGVITAQSVDSDITGHGFDNHATIRDIVAIDQVDGMEELNTRLFCLQYINSTTFSLKSLDNLDDINTTNYTEYDDGGSVYHAGWVLNTTTILANVASAWTFKRLVNSPTFDGYSTEPVSEYVARANYGYADIGQAGRPERYRYWQNIATTSSISHYLFWYPVVNDYYNVAIWYEREIPDISAWTSSTYPLHPAEVHDALWHGALAILAGDPQKAIRGDSPALHAQYEIAMAKVWIDQWRRDRLNIKNFSRSLMSAKKGFSGLSA